MTEKAKFNVYIKEFINTKGRPPTVKGAMRDLHKTRKQTMDLFTKSPYRAHKNESLCWYCKNSVKNGCSWHSSYEPIKDWTAKEVMIENQKTYNVKQCPMFEREKNTEYKNNYLESEYERNIN